MKISMILRVQMFIPALSKNTTWESLGPQQCKSVGDPTWEHLARPLSCAPPVDTPSPLHSLPYTLSVSLLSSGHPQRRMQKEATSVSCLQRPQQPLWAQEVDDSVRIK